MTERPPDHPSEHPSEDPSGRERTDGPIYRTVEETLRSDVLSRMRTYRAPSGELDLRQARHEELARHGIPRRPDPETEPRLAELWHRHLERGFRYTEAELSIDTVMGRRDPLWRHPGHPRGLEDEGSFGPSGWGGVVTWPSLLSPYLKPTSHRTNTVFAQWTIPGIFPASNPGGDITAGFWVGIDGWTNGQVLQAGVAVTVHPNATVEWWPWTEWYTTTYKDPAVRVDNFPVSVGDTISVLVCAPTTDHGFASFLNLTTGQATSVGIDQPGSDIHSAGATAEWIVEGISADLPVFLPSVTFSSCSAGTQSSEFDLIPRGITTEIAGAASGSKLTKSTIANDSVAVIQWTGWT